MNLEWNNQFPDAKLYHLPGYYSDHSPVLLDTHDRPRPTRKPFRFENAWALEESFSNIIKNIWSVEDKNKTHDFYYLYNKFKIQVCWWKKHIYGNSDKKINDTLEKIEELSYQIERNYSEDTHHKLTYLEKLHQKLLKQKNLYWKQRSKLDGDNNTKFFHAFASYRKRRNFIQSIKNDNGTWEYEIENIQKKIPNTLKTFTPPIIVKNSPSTI